MVLESHDKKSKTDAEDLMVSELKDYPRISYQSKVEFQ